MRDSFLRSSLTTQKDMILILIPMLLTHSRYRLHGLYIGRLTGDMPDPSAVGGGQLTMTGFYTA